MLQRNRIDLVHSQGARADFFARIASRLAGISHVLCTIAMPVEGFEVNLFKKKIYRFMDRLTEPFVERFIVVSESLKKTLVDGRGISAERVVRIHNGIECDEFLPDLKISNLRQQWGITPEVLVIGAVGRLVWQKGFEYLIQAIPEVVQILPNCRFLIVGEGPLRKTLEELATSLNVTEKVIFTGFTSDIKQVMANVDLLVIPSILEGFPMVTLEAMAMQKPIVATHIPGIIEQISDGEEGILVSPRNPSGLANAILLLMTDGELASKVGDGARKKVERKFSVERMVAETEKVYRSILNNT